MKTAEIITDTWVKVEAGHYVHTTDDGYTATVTKDGYGNGWTAEAASLSGLASGSHMWHESMADAREWALVLIDNLREEAGEGFIKDTWVRVEAGHYVYTTDGPLGAYTAHVRNSGYSWYLQSKACWNVEAFSHTGRDTVNPDRDPDRCGETTLAKAKIRALEQIQNLRVLDEIERLTEQLRSVARHTMGVETGITMGSTKFHPNGQPVDNDYRGSFTLHGGLHTYKVTVEVEVG